jgi:hypothetical protein
MRVSSLNEVAEQPKVLHVEHRNLCLDGAWNGTWRRSSYHNPILDLVDLKFRPLALKPPILAIVTRRAILFALLIFKLSPASHHLELGAYLNSSSLAIETSRPRLGVTFSTSTSCLNIITMFTWTSNSWLSGVTSPHQVSVFVVAEGAHGMFGDAATHRARQPRVQR